MDVFTCMVCQQGEAEDEEIASMIQIESAAFAAWGKFGKGKGKGKFGKGKGKGKGKSGGKGKSAGHKGKHTRTRQGAEICNVWNAGAGACGSLGVGSQCPAGRAHRTGPARPRCAA